MYKRILGRGQFRVIVCTASLLATAVSVRAETFTVAVVPDTQRYSDVTLPQPRGEDTFRQAMHYLVDRREEKNIVFVSFVGDLVEHGPGRFRRTSGNAYKSLNLDEGEPDARTAEGAPRDWDSRAEWDIANRSVSILGRAGFSFGMAPGNHDYEGHYEKWETRPIHVSGRTWDYYFGSQSPHFAGKPWYGGAFNQGLNSYQFFTGGGQRFLHLALEYNPGPAALNWAQGVLDANPGLPVILSTHNWMVACMSGEGCEGKRNNGAADGVNHLTPDEIWERFVRKNSMIFLILAGHTGENARVDRNDAGYPVYQVSQDYQDYTVGTDGKPGSANGGAGWLRFIAFDTDKRKMHFYLYSKLLDRYAGRNRENTFGNHPEYSEFEVDFPPQILK